MTGKTEKRMKKTETGQMDWYPTKSPKKKKKKSDHLVLILFCGFLVCCLMVYEAGAVRSRSLVTEKQTVFSNKLLNQAEILLLSDLHSDSFGRDNEDLLSAVKKEAEIAEIIVLAGDIIDDQDSDPENELDFCRKLTEIKPVYFSPGNSELARDDWPKIQEDLEEMGISVLDRKAVRISLNGNDVLIGGLYDYSFALNGKDTVEEESMDPQTLAFLHKMKEAPGFKLVISHRPDSFWLNQSGNYWDLDLVLSGHTHGGQVIIPGVGGLWAPDQGWFPEACGGLVFNEDLPVVISAGLSSGKQKLPRWNNPATITLISLQTDRFAHQEFSQNRSLF